VESGKGREKGEGQGSQWWEEKGSSFPDLPEGGSATLRVSGSVLGVPVPLRVGSGVFGVGESFGVCGSAAVPLQFHGSGVRGGVWRGAVGDR